MAFYGLIGLIIIGVGLVKDAIEQNEPYYGTSKDIFRNNPSQLIVRREAQEVVNKKRKEWEKEHGRQCPW